MRSNRRCSRPLLQKHHRALPASRAPGPNVRLKEISMRSIRLLVLAVLPFVLAHVNPKGASATMFCALPFQSCTGDADYCDNACVGGSCACGNEGDSCLTSGQCCSGNHCSGGVCATCSAPGDSCTTSGDCCTGYICFSDKTCETCSTLQQS